MATALCAGAMPLGHLLRLPVVAMARLLHVRPHLLQHLWQHLLQHPLRLLHHVQLQHLLLPQHLLQLLQLLPQPRK
jgi:hypothetical protein